MRLVSFLGGAAAVLTLCAGAADAALAACGKPGTLGVARTITIDPAGGPAYGKLQYGAHDLLRDKEVVLTFDDGPLARNTKAVLAALEAQCTKATFFLVGRMAIAYPKMVRAIADAGHTIATHTWSHKNLKSYSTRRSAGEIELGLSVIARAAGRPVAPFFRYPYLAAPRHIEKYLQSRNIARFSIDIDSYDFRTRQGEKMRRTVMRQLRERGKGIILMHDIQRSTARGLPGLLRDLKAGGYKIVHLASKSNAETRADYDATAQVLVEKRRLRVAAAPVSGPLGVPETTRTARPPGKAKKPIARTRPAPVAAARAPRRVRQRKRVQVRRPRPAPPVKTAAHAQPSMPAWKRRALGLD